MRAKGKKFKKRYLVIILILLVGGMAGWRLENWTRCVKWMSARR